MFTTAYYFRAHSYTIVPKHVREDMEWMADHGTDAICIGILEQDLYAAVENFQLVCREANRVGMKVFATPSRWGSLIAGCPKVPSIFSATCPEAMIATKNGSPYIGWLGPIASVHHPKTMDFFCEAITKMLELFPFDGIVWDEVKNLDTKDYSDAAKKALPGKDLDDINVHLDATGDFFEKVNQAALSIKPELRLSMFLFGHLRGYCVERMAAIPSLHDFGCDGRPFGKDDGGGSDSGEHQATKWLCHDGPYFIEEAKKNNKNGLMLIENHALADKDVPLMDKRLPEILSMGAEHILYYYYPRSLEDPDHNMNVIGKHLMENK